jgi:phasin family protein
MADSDDTKAETSAEKAYAHASEAIADKPVEFPARQKGSRKPAVAATEPTATKVPVAETPVDPVPTDVIVPAAKPAPEPDRPQAVAKKRGLVARPAAKPVAKRAAGKPAPASLAKGAAKQPRKSAVQKIKTAPKAAGLSPSAAPAIPFLAQLKEIPMDVTATVTDAVNGAQEKAKEAFTRTSAMFGEYGEFARGNVDALVESGKILASGLQDLGNKFVVDSKAAFETTVADVKELSSVRSPTDFFKLQTELLRRNFDSAVSYGSKTSEAMLKLTNDVIAPISGRVTLAVDKVRKAA